MDWGCWVNCSIKRIVKKMRRFIIYILVFSICKAFFNWQIIQDLDWHSGQALVNIVTITIFSLLLTQKNKDTFRFCNILNATWYVFVACTVYWVTFDLSLNIMRGLSPLYVGKTAFIDTFLGNWQFLIKGILLLSILIFENFKRNEKKF